MPLVIFSKSLPAESEKDTQEAENQITKAQAGITKKSETNQTHQFKRFISLRSARISFNFSRS